MAKLKETLISRINLAAEMGVHVGSIDRWVRTGIAGVKLVPSFIGGRLYFEREAVQRFQAGIAQAKVGADPSPAKRKTPPEVFERLKRAGFKVGTAS